MLPPKTASSYELRRYLSKLMAPMVAACVCLTLTACSSMNIQPWEKGNLAKSVMVRDSSAQHAALEQHTNMSKEATQGGYSLGAGGCGCN